MDTKLVQTGPMRKSENMYIVFKTGSYRLRFIFVAVVVGVLCVGILSGSIHRATAAEDTFTIEQIITSPDVIAPSIPTGLTGIALGTDTISLSWNASTDNVSVEAYHVFRDSVFIATTTLIGYQDTGLSPTTQYAYTVSALDGAFNESGRSATTTVETNSPGASPSPSPPSFSGGGILDSLIPRVKSIAVTSQERDAYVEWTTDISTRGVVSWGVTGEYETGSATLVQYGEKHSTQITGLSPNTTYYLRVDVESVQGKRSYILHTFSTEATSQEPLAVNVDQFTAVSMEDNITLTWENPNSSNFQSVRIVRGEKGYPQDPWAGKVVYEGDGERFVDHDVDEGKKYYYTIFTTDTSDNTSSGSTAEGSRIPDSSPVPPIVPTPPSKLEFSGNISLENFRFSQDGRTISFTPPQVIAVSGSPLLVSIPIKDVFSPIRFLMITVSDPRGPPTASYLFALNSDKTAYEAAFPLDPGNYRVKITLFDFEWRTLQTIHAVFSVVLPIDSGSVCFSYDTLRNLLILLLLVILLIVIFSVIVGVRLGKRNTFYSDRT